MITQIDHIALAVKDLDAAIAAYSRMLGLEPNWIGGGGGARHAWFQLPNMALDVISPSGEGAFGDVIRGHLETQGEGMWALAFTSDNVAADQALMTRRGISGTAPATTGSTHDDGRKRYWTTSALKVEDTAGVNLLLVDPSRDGQPWPLSTASSSSPITELDHIVIRTPNPDRALGIYGAKLGLDLRLDRSNADWGVRQLFFRCGGGVVEFGASLKHPVSEAPDSYGGLAWRVKDAEAARDRLIASGFDVSDVRKGRKPGTKVLTVRSGVPAGPALLIEQNAQT